MADADRIDPALRQVLASLAEAIFPLSLWLQARGAEGYLPPNYADLPWRAPGARLSVTDLKPVDFLERLLARDPNKELAARWNRLIASPPKFGRSDPTGWRTARGLEAATKFGILDSDNFVAFITKPDGSKQAVSLSEFYEMAWPNLRTAVGQAKPATTRDWENLVAQLRSDNIKWPGPTASEFIVRFARDCLYAMLNFTNGLPSPWDAALPIELGEFRRPNPKITADQVAARVEALLNRIG